MKHIFGESLIGTADLLQEQLQLAKATGPGYSVKVRNHLDRDELLHISVNVADLSGRKFSL